MIGNRPEAPPAPGAGAIRLGVIFLGRRRPGFDMEWGRQMEVRARDCLRRLPFALFEPPEKAVDEPSLRRALAACDEQRVEAMVLLQTTMGDGRLAPVLAQLRPEPVVLWATPENPEGDRISSCALVGAHVWASTLRQMGHPFTLVYGDPADGGTAGQLSEAVRVAAAARRLRSVRVGLIGGQAPGYFAMNADPFSLHRGLGVQLQTFSLLEFAGAVEGLSAEAVAADVDRVRALGLPHEDTGDEDLPMASRLYLAMRAFLDGENLDALAVRCWPEMPNTFGQWPYLGLARLADEGRAVACEGDVDGALSAWIAEALGLGRCYLSDWLEHDAKTVVLWHCGTVPMTLCRPAGEPGSPRIARHFNIAKPAVVEAALREDMPITVFRFWRCDGRYLLTAREGRTATPKRRRKGTNAEAELSNQDPREWFEELCHEGMPHHVVVVEGRHRALLRRMARVLGVQFV
jgi:L-fucose isomerase-like protein